MSQSVNSTSTFNTGVDYVGVGIQDGMPVLSNDLNDIQAHIGRNLETLYSTVGGNTDVGFLICPLTTSGEIPEEGPNCFLTHGSLTTRFGVIRSNPAGEMTEGIVYTGVKDGYTKNAMFYGTVSETDGISSIFDSEKLFSYEHRLTATDFDVAIPSVSSGTATITNAGSGYSSGSFSIQEPACRVLFTSGAAEGLSFEITAYAQTQLTIDIEGEGVQAGDTYVIIPGNAFDTYCDVYDNTSIESPASNPYMFLFVESFTDDISTIENPSHQHPALAGHATLADLSHRTRIGFALRGIVVQAPTGIPVKYILSLLGNLPAMDGYQSNLLTSAATGPEEELIRDSGPVTPENIAFLLRNERSPSQKYGNAGNNMLGMFTACDKALPSECDRTVLFAFTTENKRYDGQVIERYFRLNGIRDTIDESPVPMIRLQEWSTYGLPHNSVAKVWARIPHVYSVKGMSDELVKATSVTHTTTSEDSNTIVSNKYGTTDPWIAAFYPSLSSRLSFLENSLEMVSGISNTVTCATLSSQVLATPTSKALVCEDSSTADTAVGQRNLTFVTVDDPHMLNATEYHAGVLHMVDPLARTVGNFTDSTFVGGTGSYFTRSGTKIEQNDTNGWSFYENVSDQDGQTILTKREVQNGIAQAHAIREALNFRKLGVKTSVHQTQDLFTYDILSPSFVGSTGSTEIELSDIVAEDLSPVCVGAILDGRQDQEGKSPEARNSYNVGSYEEANLGDVYGNTSFKGGQYVSIDINPMAGSEEEISEWSSYYDAGNYPVDPRNRGARCAEAVTLTAGKINDKGAWGRSRVHKTSNPLDTINNRCTSMVVDWHNGDWYPVSESSNENALIDNIIVEVKILPLPQVHWATMPAHMHPVLTRSLESYSSLLDVMEKLVPLFTPDITGLINEDGAPVSEGSVDWAARAFADKHQPFVHWQHPNQELITAPGPIGSLWGDETKFKIYNMWGERSLIAPNVAYAQKTDNKSSMFIDNMDTSTVAPFRHFQQAIPIEGFAEENFSTRLGTHHPQIYSAETLSEFTEGETTIETSSYVLNFPFVPVGTAVSGEADKSLINGVPGPVFIPAFREYSVTKLTDTSLPSTLANESIFNPNLAGPDVGFEYFPRIDQLQMPSGMTSWGTGSVRTPESAFEWNFPVLRANIRPDTVAAILGRFVGTSSYVHGDTRPDADFGRTDIDFKQGSGPDVNCDTAFIGDIGTSIAISSVSDYNRTQFVNPLQLGGTWDTRGGVLVPKATDSMYTVSDGFELASKSRIYKADGDTAYLPLLSTMLAVRHMGLAQKLLWNSSLRIQHARPGGGCVDPDNHTPSTVSQAPKSLTELFLVRNRKTNQAVPLPHAPDSPDRKPYLHLESMHPAAAGGIVVNGITTEPHPNHAYMGHLYGMIQDNLGGTFSGSDDPLSSADAEDTRFNTSGYSNAAYFTGATGDTYAADAFDYAFAATTDPTKIGVAHSERSHENSGIRVDILNELRYVREHAEEHNLDATYTVGPRTLSWLDMMPTPAELTQPGDHSLIITLYPGKYGQKFADSSVPDGYNPPYAGCQVQVSIEVNKAIDTRPSSTGAGQHYGRSFNTYHKLGHG